MADQLLAPAAGLLDEQRFRDHLGGSLAVFVSPNRFEAYRLAEPTDDLAVVADRFHLKPLINALASGTTFHVLALSRNRARLLRGDAAHIEAVPLPGIPDDLDEILRFDDRERQLQSHSAGRVGPGRVSAAFHGQGGARDTSDDDLRRILHTVSAAVGEAVDDHPAAPLVLAGEGRVVAAYRPLVAPARLIEHAIVGNPDRLSDRELHDLAWPLVEALLAGRRAEAAGRFHEGALIASTAEQVVPAAADGRVEHVFVPADTQLWGVFDRERHEAIGHDRYQPGDADLADLAAVETHLHGGAVHVVPGGEIPGDGPLAAVLRH